MNVLIIPEDFRLDQFVLTPILGRLLKKVLGQRTRVDICRNPVVGGIGEALKRANIEQIITMYPMVDIFILCVDRDADLTRRNKLDALETDVSLHLKGGQRFIAEIAIEELEAWVLAGVSLPKEWNWSDIRSERDVKERYFHPYAERRGVSTSPGGGRSLLAAEAARNLSRVMHLCREDVGQLARRLAA